MQKIRILTFMVVAYNVAVVDMKEVHKQRAIDDMELNGLLDEGYSLKSEYICNHQHAAYITLVLVKHIPSESEA